MVLRREAWRETVSLYILILDLSADRIFVRQSIGRYPSQIRQKELNVAPPLRRFFVLPVVLPGGDGTILFADTIYGTDGKAISLNPGI